MMRFTACHTKINAGYMGKLLEWPEVVMEGATLDECRKILKNAAQEMSIIYHEEGLNIPQPSILLEALSVFPTGNNAASVVFF